MDLVLHVAGRIPSKYNPVVQVIKSKFSRLLSDDPALNTTTKIKFYSIMGTRRKGPKDHMLKDKEEKKIEFGGQRLKELPYRSSEW